ncbi:MAG: aminotransferase class I/II-fold pyridoxal phosphate-dependent enzyme, partial [Legionellales bacterium]|nr:aminotransferase class I/II-fold pyridoxal phosphate-dependent enzyme [Legionellales bacterium]
MLKKVYKEKILSKNKKCLRKLPNSKQKVNLDFSNNDYLGLSKNQIILSGAIKAAHEYGIGSTGSRLLSGNNELFMQFESEIANCKNTESALIFNSGFQCNAFVLASLLDNKTLKSQSLVFFDRLNHSSLYQAAFLSGAKLIRYRHNDWQHLSNLISDYSHDKRPKFIVTETVFGMDGDICPLKEIISIAKESDALLYLDEAHATGIIGKNGYGLSTEFDLNDITAVVMGTFSKALGASGAYIACDSTIKDYIINFCHGFIYSTAPSPFVIGAAQAGWQMLPGLEADRKTLK